MKGPRSSDEEKLELFAAVAEAVTVPVLAGSTFANTQQSVALTKQVAATGAAGVLATTPAYARPNQQGIAGHLGAIADATELQVMLYDIPSRTGRKIAAATTIELARDHKNITRMKDASGDVASAAHVKYVLGDGFDLYSGDDSMLLRCSASAPSGSSRSLPTGPVPRSRASCTPPNWASGARRAV